MIHQFEYDRIDTCGDCPLWCPNTMPMIGYLTHRKSVYNDGFCGLDQEDRNRFDDRPSACPLVDAPDLFDINVTVATEATHE